MKRILSVFMVLFISVQALSLFSCSKKEKYTKTSFEYFDTVTTIIGYEDAEDEFKKNCDRIFATLSEYHKLYDIYNSYDGINNLYTVNHTNGEIKVDEKVIDLLAYAKDVYKTSNGKFNVAMGSVLSIWHDYRERANNSPENAELPPIDLLTSAKEHTSIDSLIIDKEKMTVIRADTEMLIDVGGLAKGYAVEMTAKMLEGEGIDGYLLNVGGNVRAIGAKGDGKPWSVGVENPDTASDEAYIAYLSLMDESLVTSGSYQRYYEYNGKKYHHIIDTETLMPSEYYLSVSIRTKDSGLADALSTSLFTMPLDEGKALVDSLDGVEAMWVMPDGKIEYSKEFKKD